MDSLSWDFQVSTLDDSNIMEPPKVSAGTEACGIDITEWSGRKNGWDWGRYKWRGNI